MNQHSWKDLIDRIRGIAHHQRGHALVKILVLVDKEGNPVGWTEPKMTKLEPISRIGDFLEQIEDLL